MKWNWNWFKLGKKNVQVANIPNSSININELKRKYPKLNFKDTVVMYRKNNKPIQVSLEQYLTDPIIAKSFHVFIHGTGAGPSVKKYFLDGYKKESKIDDYLILLPRWNNKGKYSSLGPCLSEIIMEYFIKPNITAKSLEKNPECFKIVVDGMSKGTELAVGIANTLIQERDKNQNQNFKLGLYIDKPPKKGLTSWLAGSDLDLETELVKYYDNLKKLDKFDFDLAQYLDCIHYGTSSQNSLIEKLKNLKSEIVESQKLKTELLKNEITIENKDQTENELLNKSLEIIENKNIKNIASPSNSIKNFNETTKYFQIH